MGPEGFAAIFATIVGVLTWSHQQRQNVLNDRFGSIKRRLDVIEQDINNFPRVYASKADLSSGLSEIKDRLNHINDKLDQLILSKINEKN